LKRIACLLLGFFIVFLIFGNCTKKTTKSIDIKEPAILYVSCDTLSFDGISILGNFYIKNLGEEPLSWTITTSKVNWLTVSPISGIDSAMINVVVYHDSIKELGKYQADLYINAKSLKDTVYVFVLHGVNGLKPICLSDRWDNADGDSIWDSDEFYDPKITGYGKAGDVGIQMTLHLRNSNRSPQIRGYYAVCFPPLNSGESWGPGGDIYRDLWTGTDGIYSITIGDQLVFEPGAMIGPTNQVLDHLIYLDSTAEWDEATNTVINSSFEVSPRIIKIPVFDPSLGIQGEYGQNYLTISAIIELFIEAHNGADIICRFIKKF